MIITLAKHEIKKAFRTKKIWKILSIYQCITGLLLSWQFNEFTQSIQQGLLTGIVEAGITESILHPIFGWTTLLSIFFIPILTAYTIPQERKSHTFILYQTAPISPTTLMLGKYLGAWIIQSVLLLPLAGVIGFLMLHGTLDYGQVIASFLGLLLITSTMLAISLSISCFCQEPPISIFTSFILLILLCLVEWVGRATSVSWLNHLSILYHGKNGFSGVVHTQDILYYCLTILLSLTFGSHRLKQEITPNT